MDDLEPCDQTDSTHKQRLSLNHNCHWPATFCCDCRRPLFSKYYVLTYQTSSKRFTLRTLLYIRLQLQLISLLNSFLIYIYKKGSFQMARLEYIFFNDYWKLQENEPWYVCLFVVKDDFKNGLIQIHISPV